VLAVAACAPPQADLDPQAVRAGELHGEGRRRLEAGDAAGAVAALAQAAAASPQDPLLWNDLGLAQARAGDAAAAQQSFERAIQLAPQRYEGHLNLAVLLMRGGVSGRARTEFEQAAATAPSNPLVFWNWAVALVDVGKPEQARQHLEAALRLDPRHGPAHAEMGRVEALAGRRDAALARFATAESLGVDSAAFHANYGLELLRAQRLAEAEAHLERATLGDSTRAAAWNHLGVARLGQGRPLAAVEPLRRAHRLRPEDEDVRYNLANVLVRLERYREAVTLLETPRPHRPPLLALWGMALRGAGRRDEALPLLREAAERAPRDAGILNNYGVLLAESGDVPGALEVWRRVLQIEPENVTALENLRARGGAPDGAAREEEHGP
jgi:Flp pilus assembly protein TadD